MRNRRLVLLVLVIALMFFLTSCTFRITFTTPAGCSLVVISGACCGQIYVNGKDTGKFLEPFQSETIYVSCYQSVSVYLVGSYGCHSHTEWVDTKPGPNYVYFNYWW